MRREIWVKPGLPGRTSASAECRHWSGSMLKHDVVLLGRLDNGLGYYRFAYNGSKKLALPVK